MDTYVFEISKYVGIRANSIDEALYKFHEGFCDGASEEEIESIYKDNDFLEESDENQQKVKF